MNGLNFGRLSSSATTPLQLNLLGASKCVIYDDCKSNSEEEDSLEGESYVDGNDTNTLVESGQTHEDRDVLTFFRQFVPSVEYVGSNNNLPLQQPMSALQNRYNTLQHKINKQAQWKSIKSWFNDEKLGRSHVPWFTSTITIPNDNICAMWGLKSHHFCSGKMNLTTSENELLEKETNRKDLLLDICGEYRVLPENNTIQFKTKKAARNSAALNLLFALDVGELVENNENELPVESIILGESGMLPNGNETTALPKERFQLEYIRYYGAVKDPEGEFLCRDNPCLLQCIVSVRDMICNDLDKSTLEVISSFHQNENDSLNDASHQLKCILVDRDATDDEIYNVLSAMREAKPHISFETHLPKWSIAKLQTRMYVYELKFFLCDDGSEIPLSEAMGLDESAATRFGLICGHHVQFDENLSANFNLPSVGKISVTMCNQTEVNHSEMVQQMRKILLLEEVRCDPINLVKCFNRIIFEKGKSYGMGRAPVLSELLHLVTNENQEQPYRTSLFVPLSPKLNNTLVDIDIDWRIIWDVVNHKTSRVLPLTTEWRPIALVNYIFGIVLVCASIYCVAVARCTMWSQALPAVIATGTVSRMVSSRIHSTSLLLNYFLIQPTLFKKRVFVVTRKELTNIVALVPLLWHIVRTRIGKLNFQRLKEPWSDIGMVGNLWQCYVRCSTCPLVQAQQLGAGGVKYGMHEFSYGKALATSKYDPTSEKSITNILAARGLLVPHLTLMLPMPRDLLYLCQYATEFMPKLERAHNLKVAAKRLLELRKQASKSLVVHSDTPAVHHTLSWIDRATSICDRQTIREYERLEMLGDSVHGFFIVLNVFGKVYQNDIPHILDLFDEVVLTQGKNKALYRAGMDIGLHQTLNVAHKGQPVCQKETTEIARKQISNFMESMLGASFLIDNNGSTTIGLLNEIGPCLPTNDELDESLSNQNDNWFAGAGTCINEGYPFFRDSGWSTELKRIEDIVKNKQRILSILQSKAVAFCKLLVEQMNKTSCRDRIQMLISDTTTSLLLYAALFDDAIDDESDLDTIGLESLASLRDKLFPIGNAALQLSIVAEIYQLYPTITSGDIHFMKAAIMTHDTLAYVCVKNGWHECLFDSNADAPIIMQDYIDESDVLGAEVWAKHGGWCIPGGNKEFQRRVKQYYGYCPDKSPQYKGVAAGRLRGHKKKLPDEASNDLQFSMKCIVGALVLSFGVNKAWDVIRPFFLELLLVSPDELRNSFDDVSDLVGSYKKGKR